MAINKDHLQTNYERLDALRGYLFLTMKKESSYN